MKFWLLIAGARTSKAAPIVAVNIAIARARRISAPAQASLCCCTLTGLALCEGYRHGRRVCGSASDLSRPVGGTSGMARVDVGFDSTHA
jgi:hypothetical protein